MKLSPELWLKVDPLFTTAIEMPEAERVAWLADLDTTHPDAAPVVRRMLESHERAQRSRELETVPKLAPSPAWSSAHVPGARIGPFEVIRPLGRGGMGEVWLARQADGRIDRVVALKLPALHQQAEILAERFRRERDFLAKLEHPNIARLYDAGVTPEGQPWLAMEYVEGSSLIDHVTWKTLSIPQCLALFRQVLAAVAHAHRHLVVHRDLKPANILVDASGQVKLLDFGIAKLVDAGPEREDAQTRDITRLGGRVMTLRYAAPEQMAAGSITTATDIYSLGVILHELVTGQAPYRVVREGKALTESALLGEDPALPSSVAPKDLARLVSGDLDAIILKAMRRDPQDRYASIDLLDEDIRAHLDRRPVRARAGTWRYLAGRFAVRHKLPLALASAVLVTLAAGLVMVDQQRRVAVAQKARAERHFASVRKLANSFMFDVHGEIENLAGSLKAREILVATSLEYLEQLSKEAATDSALAVEVATAYRKLADLKGGQYGANLGDVDGAFALLRKARALLDPLDASHRDDLKLQRERRDLSLAMARMLRTKVNQESVAEARVAADIAEHVARVPGADRDDQVLLARAYGDLGYSVGGFASDPPAGLAILAKAFAVLEPMARDDPANRAVRELLAKTYESASFITEAGATSHEEREKALELLVRHNAMIEALARDFPDHLRYARNVIRGYANLASTLRELKRVPEAREAAARAVAQARPLAAGNAQNTDLQSLMMSTLGVACGVEVGAGNHEKAVEFCREALGIASRLPRKIRETAIVRDNLANATGNLGISQAGIAMAGKSTLPVPRRLSLLREGRANLMHARAFSQELLDRNIDATGATAALREIDENLAGIDAAIAKLGGA